MSSLLCSVGIRQLQLMLLKMALLLGIEIHVNVEFKGLIEPPEDQETESKCKSQAAARQAQEKRLETEHVSSENDLSEVLSLVQLMHNFCLRTCSVFS